MSNFWAWTLLFVNHSLVNKSNWRILIFKGRPNQQINLFIATYIKQVYTFKRCMFYNTKYSETSWVLLSSDQLKLIPKYSNITLRKLLTRRICRAWNSSRPLAIFQPIFPHMAKQIQFARLYLLYISNGEAIDGL